MTPNDVAEPDLLVVLRDQQHILTDKHIHGVPGIVVEILSRSTRRRDLTLKRQLFDREGVREYWIVDPEGNSVAGYRRAADGTMPLATTLGSGNDETLTTAVLPGWERPLARFSRS